MAARRLPKRSKSCSAPRSRSATTDGSRPPCGQSRLPSIKTLEDFDFSFQPWILREQIDSLHEFGCLERKENVIFLGPPGVGKTRLAISPTGAMLFFQLINRRCKHASTVVTSTKGFEDWGEVLGDHVTAAALFDRLVHHCHMVNIRGNSYRMRHRTELSKALQAAPSDQRSSLGRQDANYESEEREDDDLTRLVTSSECAKFTRHGCAKFVRR